MRATGPSRTGLYWASNPICSCSTSCGSFGGRAPSTPRRPSLPLAGRSRERFASGAAASRIATMRPNYPVPRRGLRPNTRQAAWRTSPTARVGRELAILAEGGEVARRQQRDGGEVPERRDHRTHCDESARPGTCEGSRGLRQGLVRRARVGMRADEDDLHERVEQHRPEEREDEREWNVAAGILRLAGGDRHVLEAGAGEQRC